jgi:hypothetical protein
MENAVRTAAKRNGMPVGEYSAQVWEGMRQTILKTGELFGVKHSSAAIPESVGGFGDLLPKMIQEYAAIKKLTVSEVEKRLAAGDISLLSALLSTGAGAAWFAKWQRDRPAPSGG